MSFQQLACLAQLFQPLIQLLANLPHRLLNPLLRQHEMLARIDKKFFLIRDHFPAGRVDDRQLFHLVSPELDSISKLFVRRPQLDTVAADPEAARLELDVISFVLDLDQLAQSPVPFDLRAARQMDHHLPVILRRSQAVDAGDTGDHNHVPAADQSTGGRQPQAIDLLVDRRVFFDVNVALGNVRFRLVVVVIADEIVDGVVGKKLAELGIELSGQRLVVGHHQGGLLDLLDHIGHGEGLPRAGDAHQHLVLFPFGQAADQRVDRLRLIAGGGEGTDQLKSGDRHRCRTRIGKGKGRIALRLAGQPRPRPLSGTAAWGQNLAGRPREAPPRLGNSHYSRKPGVPAG